MALLHLRSSPKRRTSCRIDEKRDGVLTPMVEKLCSLGGLVQGHQC